MQTPWLKSNRLHHSILIILLLGLLVSCEEYKEGCMDASATNFKVSNQMPCCCEYPDLVFQTTLTNGEKTLSFADTFTNGNGQRYLVRELRFLASEIVLTDSTEKEYEPTDTLGNYLIPPDVLAANVLDLNNAGANFLTDGVYNRLTFSIDQVGELQGKVPEDFPDGHPLRDSTFYNFTSESWVLAQAVIEVPENGFISLNLPANELPVMVSIPGKWTKTRGKDLIVNFRVNIETLFSEMNFTLSENMLLDEFKAKLSASFEP